MSTTTSSTMPPLSEFIDLGERRRESRTRSGFAGMHNSVTVAVYNTRAGYQTLTIRISEDLASKFNLMEGARMSCHVHPDQQFIALMPGAKGDGSALFRPRKKKGKGFRSRSLTYQTTLRGGTLEPQKATAAGISEVDHALVISINEVTT